MWTKKGLIQGLVILSLFDIALLSASSSLDNSPWVHQAYSLDVGISEDLLPHRSISTSHGDKKPLHPTGITTLSLRASPEKWDLSLEASVGSIATKGTKFRSLALEAKRELANDLVSNSYASSVSVRFEASTRNSSNRPEFELYAKDAAIVRYSIGQNFNIGRDSLTKGTYSQWWIDIGCGLPNAGRPFLLSGAYLKRTFVQHHALQIGFEYDKGFGDKVGVFHPLAEKKFSLLDISVGYTYSMPGFGSINLSLRRRLQHHLTQTIPIGCEIRLNIPFSI